MKERQLDHPRAGISAVVKKTPIPEAGRSSAAESLTDVTTTPRILIVEDQYVTAMDCQAQLARAGCACVGIANTAAQAMLLAARERPDLVLMDIRLASRTNGVDIAKEIYEQHGIRCIFVTGQSDPDLRKRAGEAHPLGWLEKPYSPSDSNAALEAALAQLSAEGRDG